MLRDERLPDGRLGPSVLLAALGQFPCVCALLGSTVERSLYRSDLACPLFAQSHTVP